MRWLRLAPRPPEFTLALFLNAGLFKGDARLAWLPVDLTMLAAGITAVLVLWSIVARNALDERRRHSAIWWPLGLAFVFLPALATTDWNPYAIEKASRFFTLTLVAAIAPIYLVDRRYRLQRFITALVIIAVVILADGVFQLATASGSMLRLTGFSATTISFGRIACIPLIVLASSILRKQLSVAKGVSLMLIPFGLLVAAGARGPLVAGIVVLLFGSFYLYGLRSARILVFAAIVVFVLSGPWFWELVPEWSGYRVTEFFNGRFGDSEYARVELIGVSVENIITHPMGIGFGGLVGSYVSSDALETRVFSHNILLEAALEGGWLAGLFFPVAVLRAVRSALRIARLTRGDVDYAFVLMYLLYLGLGDLVSGELNDSKMFIAFIALSLTLPRNTAIAVSQPSRASVAFQSGFLSSPSHESSN
jgi:O-Antigen ligase